MDFWSHNIVRHIAMLMFAGALAFIVWCGAQSLVPRPGETHAGFKTYEQFAAAYGRILSGVTPASRLAHLGFDASAPGARILSYLGTVERFMPRNSSAFDRLDPAVRACLEARDRCTAYIFEMADWKQSADAWQLLGSAAAQDARKWRVTLLVQDGRVAYKSVNAPAGIVTPHPLAAQ